MPKLHIKYRRFLMAAGVLLIGFFLLSRASSLPAQQPPDLKDIETRLNALERTVDKLFNFIIIVPSIGAILVIALELRTWLTERTQMQLRWTQESREGKSTSRVDQVMNSVNQLLSFQVKQEEQQKKLLEKFDPSHGIKAILEKVKDLRRSGQLTRHNLYQYHTEIADLASRMKNMEDLYNLTDFNKSINCHHIRGLAALLENRFQDADTYFDSISRLIVTDEGIKEKDEYIEPVSLYYRGVLLKNINDLDAARASLEKALEKWPKKNREVLTRVELAEVEALKTKYSENKQIKEAFVEIERILQDNHSGMQPLRPEQKANLKSLQERLWIIEGNYAFKAKKWAEAVKAYEQVLQLNSKNVFGNLSLGIALKKQGNPDAAIKLLDTYRLIATSDSLITHPEPRGRILLAGSAIVAANLSEANDSELRKSR
ncbi:tetratricopeptide repeat protein, partial [candidate division KSB1 bacterium]|nr:tetratricopeptide repeat protein [candidate division KSB1 bacterium]